MSVLSRVRHHDTHIDLDAGTSTGLPRQRAGSDQLLPGIAVPKPTAPPAERTIGYRRRRAGLLLAGLVVAATAGTTATILLTDGSDEPTTVAPGISQNGGLNADQARDAAARARSRAAAEERATDAWRDTVLGRRQGGVQP